MARRTHPHRRWHAWSPRRFTALAALLLLAAFSGLSTAEAPPSVPEDAAALEGALAQKHDAGVARALATAQACYRQALAHEAAGRHADAIRLLEAASAFDPDYPDAHFTLARVLALRDPSRAVGEISEGFRTLARSYPWQRHLLANTATGLIAVWIISLLVAVIGIGFRHFPHLVHMVEELISPRPSRVVRAAATLISLSPLAWGLGAIPTATLYAGLVSYRFGKREAVLVTLFLVSALALGGGLGIVAPWCGAPTLQEPSLLVDRATTSGYDADLAAALLAWEAGDPTESLFPYALGSMARRSGDLDLAERQLTLAAVLEPRSPWILTNLGNVHFAREDFARARQSYEAAAAAAPDAVEPHYNLAQVYTKQLQFAEASREQSRASAVAFDRVRDFSKWGAPQLNRTVMDAAPPPRALWSLARRYARTEGSAAVASNPLLAGVVRLEPPAPFVLVFLPAVFLIFAGIGQLLGRGLSTVQCSNCQKIVCRRCVHRMQQRAFCNDCFQSVKDLKSTEFTRLLLTRKGRSAARRRTIGQAMLTFLLPGAGQMLRGASLSGFLALLVMSAAAILVVANGAILPSLDVLPYGSGSWSKRIPLILLFLLTYAITVNRYFSTTTTRGSEMAPHATRTGGRPGAEGRVRERRS